MLGKHYAGIRRWAPTFLDAFVFQSVPAAAPLMRDRPVARREPWGLARPAEIREDQRGQLWLMQSIAWIGLTMSNYFPTPFKPGKLVSG